MFLQTTIYLLAFTFTVCYGYEKVFSTPIADLGKRGAIFDWAPQEKLNLLVTYGEDPKLLMEKEYNVGRKGFHIRCYEFKVKDKNKKEIVQLRINYRVKDDGFEGEETDIEEFIVDTCDEFTVLNSIVFYDTNQENKYTVQFKDNGASSPQPNCFSRDIEVNDKSISLSVKRYAPQPFDCKKSHYLKKARGIVNPKTWMEDGEIRDVGIPVKDVNIYPLQGNGVCQDCSVNCRIVKQDRNSFGIVDVVVQGVPIDRLYSSSCSKYSMDTSVWLHVINKRDNNKQLIYFNYLDPQGVCKRRAFEFIEQDVEGKPHLRKIVLERSGFNEITCYKMKARGIARQIAHKTGVKHWFN